MRLALDPYMLRTTPATLRIRPWSMNESRAMRRFCFFSSSSIFDCSTFFDPT